MLPRLLPLLLLAPALACAQATPALMPQPTGLGAPAVRTKADTMRAIQSLFRARRTTGQWLVGASAGVTAATGIGTAVAPGHDAYFSPTAPQAAAIIGIGTAPAWVPGAISLVRFGGRREQAVLRQYSEQATLPAYVRKRLKEKHFAQQ